MGLVPDFFDVDGAETLLDRAEPIVRAVSPIRGSTGVICCMPAVVRSTVGSLIGTSDDDGTSRCPRASKNEMNAARTSAPVM